VRDHLQAVRESFPIFLSRIADSCRRRGVDLAVILYPALVQLPSEVADPHWAEFEGVFMKDQRVRGKRTQDLLAEDVRHVHAVIGTIEEAAAANGIRTLDVRAWMQSRLESLDPPARHAAWLAYFRDRMHLTVEGNRAIAAALVDLLIRNRMVAGGRNAIGLAACGARQAGSAADPLARRRSARRGRASLRDIGKRRGLLVDGGVGAGARSRGPDVRSVRVRRVRRSSSSAGWRSRSARKAPPRRRAGARSAYASIRRYTSRCGRSASAPSLRLRSAS
jgi:hypothetical protein